jgi:hypothetical protein
MAQNALEEMPSLLNDRGKALEKIYRMHAALNSARNNLSPSPHSEFQTSWDGWCCQADADRGRAGR